MKSFSYTDERKGNNKFLNYMYTFILKVIMRDNNNSNNHEYSADRKKEESPYKCNDCDRSFESREHFENHRLSQNGS